GFPKRLSGTDSTVRLLISSESINLPIPPVRSIGPGAIAFTRIPYLLPHSTASVLVKLKTPALEAALCTTPAPASHAYVATIFSIEPLICCLIQYLPTAWLQ